MILLQDFALSPLCLLRDLCGEGECMLRCTELALTALGTHHGVRGNTNFDARGS